MNIYEQTKKACKIRGITAKSLEESAEIGKRSLYNWSTSAPAADKLLKVAKLLNTTMEYLMGETEDIDARISSSAESIAVPNSIEEKDLLEIYRSVSIEGKAAIMTAARAFAGKVDYTKKESASVTA